MLLLLWHGASSTFRHSQAGCARTCAVDSTTTVPTVLLPSRTPAGAHPWRGCQQGACKGPGNHHITAEAEVGRRSLPAAWQHSLLL